MSRLIAIEPTAQGAIAARLEDGRLEDLLADAPSATPLVEEIHLVRVKRVIAAQGAAHVKLAEGGKGFLRDAKGLKEGQLVIAQVSGYAEAGKAAPMTARRLHRGRYAILTPAAPGVNVARAIRDREERDRLAAIAAPLIADDGPGLIVRSASEGVDAALLEEDIADLLAMDRAVLEGAASREPGRLAEAPGAELTAWREWGEPDEVIRETGAFERLGVWDMIAALHGPAKLPGGGWMAVEPTAALVAVDVNTGDDMAADAAARANLAACADLPRQLRLRGLGGQIAVDFAPMRKNDRKAVESALRKALMGDPVQTTLAGWTPLGHFEMLRKRERRPLTEALPDA